MTLKENIINIPLSVIIASFIIIIITSGMTDSNGLSALIGGYSGLLLGIIFVAILKYPPNRWMDFVPFAIVISIISLMIFYLGTYFDTISSGQVSGYYGTFSTLSTIFLAVQIRILLMSTMNLETSMTNKTYALLGLFGTINILLVITVGVVLHFYSTQG